MLFSLSPKYLQWFGLYKSQSTMVDCQTSLEAWLQNASLFHNDPLDYTDNFDLLSNEKANSEAIQDILGLKDLEWLDEKVDLSVLENPKGVLGQLNETEGLMDDDIAAFWGFLDSDFNPSALSPDNFKQDESVAQELDSEEFIIEADPVKVSDSHLASPRCNTLQVDPATFYLSSSPSSVFSDISDADEPSNKVSEEAVDSVDIKDEISTCNEDVPAKIYVSSISESSVSSSPEVFSIEEVAEFVKKRRFSGKAEIPKVKISLLKEPFHPYNSSPKPKDRRERKKVQNKEAAARYRIKKRIEEKELLGEVSVLEQEQKKLKDKHDDLQSEIKYLKSLMCEILEKRGMLK